MESLKNIEFKPTNSSPSIILDLPLHSYINKFVKKPFTCIHKYNINEYIQELMWVKIIDVYDDKTFIGILINTPENLTPIKYGDSVLVKIDTIKQIL